MCILLLLLLSNCIYAQTDFSLKKEGNSIVLLSSPEAYKVKADTVPGLLYFGRGKKSVEYHFLRTVLHNKECYISLRSRLASIFTTLEELPKGGQKNEKIYNYIKRTYKISIWFKGKIISYKISPMQQHTDGYHYVDIFETTYRKGYKKHVSIMSRVFIIDGIEHRISVYTKGYPYNKTIRSSRKAVCCVFEELVNNLVVELE